MSIRLRFAKLAFTHARAAAAASDDKRLITLCAAVTGAMARGAYEAAADHAAVALAVAPPGGCAENLRRGLEIMERELHDDR